MDAERVAAEYEVSRAWVHRLVQRRRETGSIAPRKQTKFRRRTLSDQQEARLAALITRRVAIDTRTPVLAALRLDGLNGARALAASGRA